MNSNGFSAWLEIDLDIIRQNVKELLRISQTEVMAIVKANGYGHGAAEIAKASVEAGATWCGVARLEEAIALRRAGLNCQILVLGYTSPDRVAEAVNNNVCLTIYDQQIGEAYAEQAKNVGGGLRLHIKVDTGMGRLGISPETALEFIENLSRRPQLLIEGIFTHFARADEPQAPTTNEQLVMFDQLIKNLRKDGIAPKYIHAANSAAILNYPAARFDLVRPGISLYGFPPSPETPFPDSLQTCTYLEDPPDICTHFPGRTWHQLWTHLPYITCRTHRLNSHWLRRWIQTGEWQRCPGAWKTRSCCGDGYVWTNACSNWMKFRML